MRTKVSQFLIFVIVLTLFFHTRRWHQSKFEDLESLHRRFPDLAAGGATPEEQYLARLKAEYGLTNETLWRAWRVTSSERAHEGSGGAATASVTQITTDFASNRPGVIDVNKPDRSRLHAWKQLKLPVAEGPLPAQVDASNFLFGITTTYARITAHDYALVKDWARWMTGGDRNGNGASFVLVLEQASEAEVHEVDQVLDTYGIDAHITTSLWPMSTARRYFELVRIMKMMSVQLASNGRMRKWYGLLDDDVFLPGLSYLQDRLYAYNSNDELYIGLPSERADWEEEAAAVTTYGGGAVFLSHPAVMRISDLPCLGKTDENNNAAESFRAKTWDALLQSCVMEHTDLTMRVLPSFYSPGDTNSQADSYEMGVQPLVLHRYEDRHQLNPSMAHLVTNVCGEACFLQRYRFRDDWILVNGYSITEYPDGLTLKDTSSSQFRLSGAALSDRKKKQKKRQERLSPLSRVLVDEGAAAVERTALTWKGGRNVWRLLDSAIGKSGAVWQAYIKKGGVHDGNADGDWRDSVIVLIWEAGLSS